MAIATWELDRTDHRHPVTCGDRPTLRTVATDRHERAEAAFAPARRPAPLRHPDRRAATRPGVRARVRRRLAGLALLVLAAVAFAVVPGGDAGAAEPAAAGGGGAVLVVGPGETVWGLVAPHAPAGADIAVYVADVLDANGLEATAVAPGTVVRIP